MPLYPSSLVRVHHPLQQGLRRERGNAIQFLYLGTSASSITTRIKTNRGLSAVPAVLSASASSITTRIKTLSPLRVSDRNPRVRVHHPPQQGLDVKSFHSLLYRRYERTSIVQVKVSRVLRRAYRSRRILVKQMRQRCDGYFVGTDVARADEKG